MVHRFSGTPIIIPVNAISPTPGRDPVPSPSSRDQRVSLVIIAFAVLMASLDSMMVNFSLPCIAQSFEADHGTVSWAVPCCVEAVISFFLGPENHVRSIPDRYFGFSIRTTLNICRVDTSVCI
ncbi:MAG: hypothetical protein WC342_04090 [Methanoregula sp.]|jgi:hypothetical protein